MTYYKIHTCKVCNPVIFIIIKRLCTYHHYLILECLYHPQKKPCTLINHYLFAYFLTPAIMNLFSISMALPTLDISYILNCAVFTLLCMASFTEHTVLRFICYIINKMCLHTLDIII